jgi:uncharacterized membrane protein YphA (DoxX/SURF4 family)
MFLILRVIRGFLGFVFFTQGLQVFVALLGLVNAHTSTGQAELDTGKVLALALMKGLVSAGAGFCFFWLRGLINKLHEKKYGEPHPVLAEKKWNL